MPNWCTNEVSIYGHKNEEQLKQFIDECITGTVIDFEKVMPYPDSAPSRDDLKPSATLKEQLDHPYQKWYNDIGYNWCIKNWGTKWTASSLSEDMYISDDEVQVTFDTAWGPPSGIYHQLVNKYPDLHFSWFYKEEGMQVAGWLPE